MRLRLICLTTALFITATIARAQDAITAASLLRDMTDLTRLAEFPNPPYTCKQFSSFDRASTTPNDPKTWFANNDCGQYLRVEDKAGRKEYVMADMPGPGAIVRMWSANPEGTLRIYLDGADKPTIEAPMNVVLGGKFAGWPQPISGEYSKGWNLYFPIPYARSCKVTSDKGGFYYHVNYRTYPAGTNVTTFTLDQLKAMQFQIAELAQKLSTETLAAARVQAQALDFDINVDPGDSISSGPIPGPSAIAQIIVNVTANNRDAALRGLIVRAKFDDESTVECPLGDLFGSSPGVNAYASLPFVVSKDGQMICNWVMPFKQAAEISVENLTKEPASIRGQLVTVPYTWTDSTMHFHAKWRTAFDVNTRPMQDWNYLTTKGKGVFTGVAFSIDNPVKDWWGEGDEKIYVDGETFPSHFGTGTEDYYGYAWCWPAPFTHAYHNQTRCDGPGNFGRTSVNRFHILDRIPFTKDFKFDMELWHWKECKVNMSVVDYWYAMPGATDAFKPIAAADVVLRPAPVLQIYKVPGAIEGETMRIIQKTANADPQDWSGTSGERQLWWHNRPQPGDTLILGFNVEKAGKYRVFGRFLKASDYGIAQLAVNGEKAGQPIDFYNPEVVATKEIELGTFELKQGENRFSATITGANEKAVKEYMFGLDYILLKPAD